MKLQCPRCDTEIRIDTNKKINDEDQHLVMVHCNKCFWRHWTRGKDIVDAKEKLVGTIGRERYNHEKGYLPRPPSEPAVLQRHFDRQTAELGRMIRINEMLMGEISRRATDVTRKPFAGCCSHAEFHPEAKSAEWHAAKFDELNLDGVSNFVDPRKPADYKPGDAVQVRIPHRKSEPEVWYDGTVVQPEPETPSDWVNVIAEVHEAPKFKITGMFHVDGEWIRKARPGHQPDGRLGFTT